MSMLNTALIAFSSGILNTCCCETSASKLKLQLLAQETFDSNGQIRVKVNVFKAQGTY
jgi:hypothetical protein